MPSYNTPSRDLEPAGEVDTELDLTAAEEQPSGEQPEVAARHDTRRATAGDALLAAQLQVCDMLCCACSWLAPAVPVAAASSLKASQAAAAFYSLAPVLT